VSSSSRKNIRIHDNPEQQVLSTSQKQFNSLIKKIATKKILLIEWQKTIFDYQQRIHSEYHPLLDSYNHQRSELVYLLDNAYHDKHFKPADKTKIQQIIVDLTLDLMTGHGKQELKPLYNQYRDSDFDTDNQAQNSAVTQAIKAKLKKLYGVEISDEEDISSPEKLQAILQEKLQAMHSQRFENTEAEPQKTLAELEAEALQAAEQKNLSKSIQAVYRQLAAVLHPDRELDETERERKTKLMQQVNVAYDKKDLLRLLELQLEIEQINQAQLNTIAEERLRHFNKILQNQLDELQDEITEITQGFKQQSSHLSPKKLLDDLEMNIRNMQRNISRLKLDLEKFHSPTTLKTWLKSYRNVR
jgi:hypothetical protein